MGRSARFWLSMAVFQIAFGLVVFAATRHYYLARPGLSATTLTILDQPPPAWTAPAADAGAVTGLGRSAPSAEDPEAISRSADAAFADRRYDTAADLYARLLALAPDSVDVHNNLGLTLHYLGRSEEALEVLNRGVAKDPSHQRIWLTLGFVQSQRGAYESARSALTNATQIGSDDDIRRSAQAMLQQLP